MMKSKFKLFFLRFCSFIVSVAPLVVVLIMNWGKYTETPAETVKLCIGGVLCLLFVLMKVLGKLKIPSRLVLFFVVFLMAYLMQSVLEDLLLLSGMALLGESVDFIFFQKAIKTAEENILVDKTATETAKQVESIIEKHKGRF